MSDIDFKKLYREIYKKIDLIKILDEYDIDYSEYHGHKGREFQCCCPFPDHDDLSPSFSIREKDGVYNCFVCGGGNLFTFVKKMEKLPNIMETIKFIKIKVGIGEEKAEDVFDKIGRSYEEMLAYKRPCDTEEDEKEVKEIKYPQCFEPAEKYLSKIKFRVSLKNIKKWKMMYCHDPKSTYDEKYRDRLIIPVYFENKLATFAARDMSGRSDLWKKIKDQIKAGNYTKDQIKELRKKYEVKKILYPFGAPLLKIFFNWDKAVKKDYVIICEGVFDAIKLINFGYNAVAALSCHINPYRIKLLIKNFNAIDILLDNDMKIDVNGKKKNPGQDAAKKILECLEDICVSNILLPQGKDPDDCIKKEINDAFSQKNNYFKLEKFF